METLNIETNSKDTNQRIDWNDIRVGILIGCLFIVIKGISFLLPDLQLGKLDSLIPFFFCVQYSISRARREPEKLDEWGITTPISRLALVIMAALLVIAIAALEVCGLLIADTLPFEFNYIPKMVEYIISAFPQQFFLCSVCLVTLSKISFLKGHWRLPLVVGLLFSAAHFWTPSHIPGTGIPLQMIVTFPIGFTAAWYFLKFRTILPLTVAHAILYILLHQWIELQL